MEGLSFGILRYIYVYGSVYGKRQRCFFSVSSPVVSLNSHEARVVSWEDLNRSSGRPSHPDPSLPTNPVAVLRTLMFPISPCAYCFKREKGTWDGSLKACDTCIPTKVFPSIGLAQCRLCERKTFQWTDENTCNYLKTNSP